MEENVSEFPDGKYMSPAEVVERFAANNIVANERTLASWRNRGKGPDYFTFGKKIYYSETSIEEWRKENDTFYQKMKAKRNAN